MTRAAATNCLEIFFADTRAHGDWPLLYAMQEGEFRDISKKEAGTLICIIANALQKLDLPAQARVAFHAAVSPELWVAEWGVYAHRATAVLIPRDFAPTELIETLAESKSMLAVVSTLAIAHAIRDIAARLPDLKYIVCFEGAEKTTLPILSWEDFIASGRELPPQPKEILRSLSDSDSAILFYHKDEEGVRQATLYTHAQLLGNARKIDATLGQDIALEGAAIPINFKHKGSWRQAITYGPTESRLDYIRTIDSVLAAGCWDDITGHLAAYYVPVLKKAAVQVVSDVTEIKLPDYRPHAVIAHGAYFDGLREQIIQQMRKSGGMKWQMFLTTMALGKIQYEAIQKLGPLQHLLNAFMRVTIVKKVQKMLGGRLRLLIGVDYAASYETKILFYTFGMDFIELPTDILK